MDIRIIKLIPTGDIDKDAKNVADKLADSLKKDYKDTAISEKAEAIAKEVANAIKTIKDGCKSCNAEEAIPNTDVGVHEKISKRHEIIDDLVDLYAEKAAIVARIDQLRSELIELDCDLNIHANYDFCDTDNMCECGCGACCCIDDDEEECCDVEGGIECVSDPANAFYGPTFIFNAPVDEKTIAAILDGLTY